MPPRDHGSPGPWVGPLARSILLAVCLLAGGPVRAARTALRVYTPADGVPQAQVTAVCQDRDGYLWVGTLTGGVGRYDGRRWLVDDASTGLPGSTVQALVPLRGGGVAVATNGGVAFRRGRSWKRVELATAGAASPFVWALAAAPDGRLAVGTSAGLGIVPAGGAAARSVSVRGPELAGAEVLSLAWAPDGSLWAGTTKGVAVLRPGPGQALAKVPGFPDRSVPAIAVSATGAVAAGVSDEGLFVSESGGAPHRVGDDAMPGRRVISLAWEDDAGGLWGGSRDRGAFRWDGKRAEPLGASEGLAEPRVWSICEDREGIVWLGTDSGLVKKGPSAFVTLGADDGLPRRDPVYGMAQSLDGSIWFVAHDRGLVRRSPDGRTRRFTEADGLPGTDVFSVAADPRGGVLVAARRGLARIDGDAVKPFRLPADAAVHEVSRVAFGTDGTLVVGSDTDGMAIVRPDGTASRPGPPVGRRISTLYPARDGTIWAGGPGWGAVGLGPGGTTVAVGRANGLPSENVNGIVLDSRGTLWIATEGGLFSRERDGKVVVRTLATGFPDSYVYWVGEDRDGFVWAGTNRGAVRIAPTGDVRVFTSNDGLGASECNEDGFLLDRDGHVWLATEGISLFRGVPAARHPVDPAVRIEEVRVGEDALPAAEPLRLAADHPPVTIRFAALSYFDEAATRFRYRLRGLSDAWVSAGPDQAETTYGRLGPGRYTFEVTARTVDGRSPREPASFAFTVLSPWWRTPAAGLGAALLVAGAFLGLVRFREGRLLAARRRLERTVAERTEELRRANEQLSALAVTDVLTGLPNRRRVLQEAGEAFALARRSKVPFALAMIDIDHFKEVNDSLGHAEGDRLLGVVARTMRDALRTTDHLGRYGGEEFLAFFPLTGVDGAAAGAERIRRAVEEVRVSPGPGPGLGRGHASVSIGVAVAREADETLPDLIHRADGALYRAKQSGRNRVHLDV